MHKLGLIIRREYLSRVTRRSFILATLLTPLAFALFFVVVGVIFSYESDDNKTIAVLDQGDVLKGALKDSRNIYYQFEDQSLDSLRAQFKDLEYDGILVIPPVKNMLSDQHTVYFYAESAPTLDIEVAIREQVADAIRDYKIEALELERKQLDALNVSVDLEPEPIEEGGEDATRLTGAIAAGLGLMMGFIMYITVFVYGIMVMRSVMEEKTNRIVEVMISSVRPFELMMGKIIGVGAVGLTQVAVWAILIPFLTFLAQLIFGFDMSAGMTVDASTAEISTDDMEGMIALAMQEINGLNWWVIFPLFVVYFLGGFFIYSSMFAAVGSAIGDDTGESQSLTLPITIPVILALYIMMAVIQSPNSSLAVWSSIFPLFSPIVMPARLAFSPPVWEVVASIAVMIATAFFLVWLSGRIYRVGILSYGKKASFKELVKWTFSKD